MLKGKRGASLSILQRVEWQLSRLRMESAQVKLAQMKGNQERAFYALRSGFSSIYGRLKEHDVGKFTTPLWENFNAELERIFLPNPPFSFLKNKIIRDTMFVAVGGNWLKKELAFLEEKISRNELKFLLQEDYVGEPILSNSKYLTSHNTIHHLYHFARFLARTHCNLDQIDRVVEWGGGYGNMAKIFKRLKAKPFTYIIIDTPLFSCIQWIYLTTILREENVNLIENCEDDIRDEKINLVPLCFLDCHAISSELFISTWALSESSRYSQDYVANHEWFNSKHILVAYQDSSKRLPDADRVGRLAKNIGAVTEQIEFLPAN